MEITNITLDLVKMGIFSGYMLVIFGLLSLFFPKALIKLNDWANKLLVSLDKNTFSHRVVTGTISCLLGLSVLFMIYKFGM